jgi:hypothetical protein
LFGAGRGLDGGSIESEAAVVIFPNR